LEVGEKGNGYDVPNLHGRKSILTDELSRRRWLVRRQGLKKEKEAGLRRIPLQPAALSYYR
jgi:hypothetical protein